jgi:uncharacterized protein YraI
MPTMRLSYAQLSRVILLALALSTMLGALAQPVRSQSAPTAPPSVFAEAIQQANLRAGPGIDYPQVGTIVAGTKYPLVGRNARFPWYLIALPETLGWVYKDLVTVTGNPNTVPFSELIISPTPTKPATEATIEASPPVVTETGQPAGPSSTPLLNITISTITSIPVDTAEPSSTPTLAAVPSTAAVMAEAMDTINVRYGPGTDFPRIGTITKGTQYPVLRRHTLYPWLELGIPTVPGQRGWVFRSAVTVTGNLNSVPVTSVREFGYPTLTATPLKVVTSIPPWPNATPSAGNVDATLEKLSIDIYEYLLKQKFEPGTPQQASVFLMDMRSGQAFSLNPGIAYSGMSLIKIPILVSLFARLETTPTQAQADYIGYMMVCSDNLASNAVLRLIGDGDVFQGAQQVTQTMQAIGLKDTFMVGPFSDDPKVTPQPISTIKTTADQLSTDPDLFNQSTPYDLGWLLGGIYQCAIDGSGPLAAALGGRLTLTECRQIFQALNTDKIGVMIEAGVPDGVVVAHKHGWINDTHGDSALVLTPGGDYSLTVVLHGKTWLSSEQTFPIVSEISRMVYNAYNPGRPLDKIHPHDVPIQCTPDAELLKALRATTLPPIR